MTSVIRDISDLRLDIEGMRDEGDIEVLDKARRRREWGHEVAQGARALVQVNVASIVAQSQVMVEVKRELEMAQVGKMIAPSN